MIQYGPTAMRMQRQHSATRVFLVLAVVLASLGAGALASSGAGGAADQLAASRSRPGLESAAPRDRVPALRPPDQHLTIRVGRQMLSYGSGRLISNRYGPNVLETFDGVRAALPIEGIANSIHYGVLARG